MTDGRLAALRALLDECSLDGLLISRSANKRYYAGFRLGDSEGPTSGFSGTLLVTRDANLILAPVREAQSDAIDAIRPGVSGQELDAIARERIERGGVEPYGHGLGHGIGLETHEPPRLRRSESFTLAAEIVFSVEPGVYLPGETGIRIEDIVALEESGPRLLTSSPREPVTIG